MRLAAPIPNKPRLSKAMMPGSGTVVAVYCKVSNPNALLLVVVNKRMLSNVMPVKPTNPAPGANGISNDAESTTLPPNNASNVHVLFWSVNANIASFTMLEKDSVKSVALTLLPVWKNRRSGRKYFRH